MRMENPRLDRRREPMSDTQLLLTIRLVQQLFNPDLMIEGVLLTMYDSRTNLSAQVAEEARVAENWPRRAYDLLSACPVRHQERLYRVLAEIAALTGAREGTVKSWLSRGRAKLAAALKGDE